MWQSFLRSNLQVWNGTKGRLCLLFPLYSFQGEGAPSKSGDGLSGHKEKAVGLLLFSGINFYLGQATVAT